VKANVSNALCVPKDLRGCSPPNKVIHDAG
jgi:hypothetical protein